MNEQHSTENIGQSIKSTLIQLGYARVRHNPAYTAHGPVKDILARYNESDLTACPHVASLDIPLGLSRGKRPEVVLWAAWKPDILVCHDCRDMLTLSDDTENHRCDSCGIVSEILTTGTSVIPAEIADMPPLACVYGLCKKCAKASGLK